jgi:hypothetical protein
VNSQNTWQQEYQAEIEHAELARLNGNEGMARVCARRAAGVIIGEYLSRHGHSKLTHSAYDRITLFNRLPEVDQELKDITQHFLLKVNKYYEFANDLDLIKDARILKKALLTNEN